MGSPSVTGAAVPPGSATTDQPPKSSFKRVLTGSMAGAVLEWYDFAIYGILAATVLGPLFFPGDDGVAKLLLALATQGLGFIARPLGGIVFGHLGDKFGRKPMLVTTFILLGTATAAIGLLPTYDQIGIWATVALVVLRMIQGFALGGEFGAAVLLVSEYGEPKKRGFWASWPQAGAPMGTVLATVIVSVLGFFLTDDAFDQWGWRVAFLFAIPLLIVGFWCRPRRRGVPGLQGRTGGRPRRRLRRRERSSILEALSRASRRSDRAWAAARRRTSRSTFTRSSSSRTPRRTSNFHRGDIILAVTFASLFQFVGHDRRRAGRTARPQEGDAVPAIILVVGAGVLLAGPAREPADAGLGVCVGAFSSTACWRSGGGMDHRAFPTRYRYAGSSLVFQGLVDHRGGPAPFIAVWLIENFGVGTVIGYLVVTMAITGWRCC